MPGEYKDFAVEDNDPYPLKGVTYPTNYGDIPGYTGEDGHPLDLFIGTGDLLGYFLMYRPELQTGIEHKFYLNLTKEEEAAVLEEFKPVLRGHARFASIDALQQAIEPFKDKD